MRFVPASLVAVAAFFCVPQAHASLVTYSFTAHIDGAPFDTGGIDTSTGSWTVDTSVAPLPTSTQNFASFIGAVTSMTFSIGADTWTGSGDIFVQHHFGSLTSDNYSVFSSQSSGPGKTEIFSGIPMTIGILAIILTQDPGTLFTDARNLPVDLPLNQFNVPPSGGFDNPQSHVDMQFLN